MKKFPKYLAPTNSSNFEKLRVDHYSIELREAIKLFLVERTYEADKLTKIALKSPLQLQQAVLEEDLCFNIEKFTSKIGLENVKKVIDELHIIGWKTDIVHGDTTLYVYKDKIPGRCSIAHGNSFC